MSTRREIRPLYPWSRIGQTPQGSSIGGGARNKDAKTKHRVLFLRSILLTHARTSDGGRKPRELAACMSR